MTPPIPADLLIHSAQVCTIPDPGEPKHGEVLGDLGRIDHGAVAIQGGKIVALGKTADVRAQVAAEDVIDASGNVNDAKQCIDLADNRATILWAAVYGKDVEIGVSPFLLYAKELTITSTFVSPYSFPRSLNLLSKLELQPLITDIVPLKDIAKAFELHKTGKSIKILIKP